MYIYIYIYVYTDVYLHVPSFRTLRDFCLYYSMNINLSMGSMYPLFGFCMIWYWVIFGLLWYSHDGQLHVDSMYVALKRLGTWAHGPCKTLDPKP